MRRSLYYLLPGLILGYLLTLRHTPAPEQPLPEPGLSSDQIALVGPIWIKEVEEETPKFQAPPTGARLLQQRIDQAVAEGKTEFSIDKDYVLEQPIHWPAQITSINGNNHILTINHSGPAWIWDGKKVSRYGK